jgi:hypothetical protein
MKTAFPLTYPLISSFFLLASFAVSLAPGLAFSQTLSLEELSKKLTESEARITKAAADLKSARNEHDASERELASIRRENQCEKSYLLLANPMADLVDSVLAGEGEQGINFKMQSFGKAQDAAMTALEEAVRKVQTLPVEGGTLGNSLKESSRLFSVHSPTETDLLSKEADLQGTLSRNTSFLRSVESHVVSLGLHSCPSLGAKPTSLAETANSWANKTSAHYARVADMSAKRMRLREALDAAMSAWLLRQGSVSTASTIDALQSQIDEAFKAERFLEKVGNWWVQVEIGMGPARGLMDRYQQYEGSLATLRTDLVRAQELLEEAGKFNLPPDTLEIVQRVVFGHKKTLQGYIETLEKEGWEKKLKLQRAYLDRYEKHSAPGNPLCGKLITANRAKLAFVSSATSFASREKDFMAVVDACRAK